MSALVEDLQGERPTLGFVAAVMEGSRGNPLIAGQLVAAEAELAGLRLSDPFDEILQARAGPARPAGGPRAARACRRPPAVTEAELAALRLPDGHLPRNALRRRVASGLAIAADEGSPSSTTCAPRPSIVRCCRASGTRSTPRWPS